MLDKKMEEFNLKYEYGSVRTDKVAENINEYIVPECQQACKSFWSKNIMTFMCNNYNEPDDTKYVLIGSDLSEENKKILDRLLEEDPEHYYYSKYRNAYGIRLQGNDLQIVSQKLANLTDPFKMQDIHEGKMTREEFLMDIVGLVKYQENPEFDKYHKDNPRPKMEDFQNPMDYWDALDRYDELEPPMRIRLLDDKGMTKSFEEYLKEYGYQDLYDSKNDIIFVSDFYKNAHLRYLKYKAEIENRPCETGLSPERIEEGKDSINPCDLETPEITNSPIQE